MPHSAFGLPYQDDADEGIGRGLGKAAPKRSRVATSKSPKAKARTAREKRKLKTQAGIHQRRNKRMSW